MHIISSFAISDMQIRSMQIILMQIWTSLADGKGLGHRALGSVI